jgi:type II secretory pathway component PulM
MMNVNEWLQRLSSRERRIVIAGAVAAAVLLVVAIVLPLDRSVARAAERVERKSADLAWMRSVAPDLAAVGPAGARGLGGESLVVVVDRVAREAGVGASLTSSQPSGDGALRVRLERASFDATMAWLARLADQHGVRVDVATMDAAGEPGLVNASVVLRGP